MRRLRHGHGRDPHHSGRRARERPISLHRPGLDPVCWVAKGHCRQAPPGSWLADQGGQALPNRTRGRRRWKRPARTASPGCWPRELPTPVTWRVRISNTVLTRNPLLLLVACGMMVYVVHVEACVISASVHGGGVPMDNHLYLEDYDLKERLDRPYREAEQWRLMRLATAQNDGHRGRSFPARSATALWNPLVAWVGRTVGPIRVALSDARSWWVASRKPEEQCC